MLCMSIIVSCIMLMMAPADAYAAGSAKEAELRALFVYHFIRFTTLPATEARKSLHTIKLCIHDEEMASLVDSVVRNEKIDGKPVVVVRQDDMKRLGECSVYYVGGTADFKSPAAHDFLYRATKAGVLTMGDTEAFISMGGMVALVRENSRIHPLINTQKLEDGRIALSPRILKLSTTINK